MEKSNLLRTIVALAVLLGLLTASFGLGWYSQYYFDTPNGLLSPLLENYAPTKDLPLKKYALDQLASYNFEKSVLTLESVIETNSDYTSYIFSYVTMGKKMTGQLNVPANLGDEPVPVVVMLRGYVPPEIYQTGVGTKNAASVFASDGFVTVAPDFFGYGESDPELEDPWEARFIKPIVVVELIKSLEQASFDVVKTEDSNLVNTASLDEAASQLNRTKLDHQNIFLWAHSNGGQIALSALAAFKKPIPTTLWAPVTAPFPYSVLYFSDELEDEGKVQRAWIAMFERDYDVFDFSITKHLDLLTGPIQVHHGSADDAALQVWSDEFIDKIEAENERREEVNSESANSSATGSGNVDLENSNEKVLPPIDITYHTYPGADHNLQPSWNTVVQRDLTFFRENLK